jgi:hypothetical protein
MEKPLLCPCVFWRASPRDIDWDLKAEEKAVIVKDLQEQGQFLVFAGEGFKATCLLFLPFGCPGESIRVLDEITVDKIHPLR